jgi:zinc protease
MQQIGATGLNGTTSLDRTNYFQTVPTPALDLVLWLESDRMGHLLGALTQEKLDNQRGVVQNEKRQGDNRPYGRVNYALYQGLFPAGHPYRELTIGSMEDLNTASLEDVKAWFRGYYGPNNAILALAGDIDLATAREQVAKAFGDIPPPVPRSTALQPGSRRPGRIPGRPSTTRFRRSLRITPGCFRVVRPGNARFWILLQRCSVRAS